MLVRRTSEELRHAVDSMFRIRAVELPPEPDGTRTIWHKGAHGADLLTVVDATGKVSRQELTLFEDAFRWQPGTGLQTGDALEETSDVDGRTIGDLALDQDPARAQERITRAATAVETYAGDDKILLHLRTVLLRAQRQDVATFDLPVTRSSERVRLDLVHAALERHGSEASQKRRARLWALAVGVGLFLAALLGMLLWAKKG